MDLESSSSKFIVPFMGVTTSIYKQLLTLDTLPQTTFILLVRLRYPCIGGEQSKYIENTGSKKNSEDSIISILLFFFLNHDQKKAHRIEESMP